MAQGEQLVGDVPVNTGETRTHLHTASHTLVKALSRSEALICLLLFQTGQFQPFIPPPRPPGPTSSFTATLHSVTYLR